MTTKAFPYPPNPFIPEDQRDTPLRPPSGARVLPEVAGTYALMPEEITVTEDDVETGPRHEAVSTLHQIIQAHDALDTAGREALAAIAWTLVRLYERAARGG